MTSWANLKSSSLKKQDIPIRSYFEPVSDDYATSVLGFLYGFLYSQKNAEPFYIRDSQDSFQSVFKNSPILHYIKERPPAGKNLATCFDEMAPVLNNSSVASLRRNCNQIFEYTPVTLSKIDTLLSSTGLSKQTFDVGIVLDLSGCVPAVVQSLKDIQTRTEKKTMKVFVMTDSMDLLQEFVKKGDKSWSYVSLLRFDAPTDKESRLLKTLAELTILRKQEYLVLRLSSSIGKILYLTNPNTRLDSQIVSYDGSTWKAIS